MPGKFDQEVLAGLDLSDLDTSEFDATQEHDQGEDAD